MCGEQESVPKKTRCCPITGRSHGKVTRGLARQCLGSSASGDLGLLPRTCDVALGILLLMSGFISPSYTTIPTFSAYLLPLTTK